MKWPWVSRRRYEVEIARLKDDFELEKYSLRQQMRRSLREAVDRLPSLHSKLERFLDLKASASIGEVDEWYKPDGPITLTLRLDINRELVPGITSEEMAALVASNIAGVVRYKIEEMKEVNIPAILAEALREDPMKDGDDEDQ